MAKTNKGRKLFATTATAALVASAIVPVASAAEFTDANKIASWAKEAVEYLADNGIIEGSNGAFNPTGNITRAEAATIFTKALELDTTGTENFSDVAPGQWWYEAIVGAYNAGIVNGKGAGLFEPKANLTRAEAAKMIVEAYGFEGEGDITGFSDFKSVEGKWSEEYLAIAVGNEIINGKDGKLAPNDAISRQEFATMFKRALDAAEVDPATALVEALEDVKTTSEKLVEKVTAENVAAAKTATADAKEAITAAEEALKAAKEAEVVTEEEVKAAEEAIAAAKAALEKAEKAVADYESSLTTLAVQSVSATNLKEVVVTFNRTVDAESAENEDNYTLASGSVDYATLSEDGKSVTLTVVGELDNQVANKLTIKNVKAGDKVISATDVAFTPLDNTLPTVASVSALGTKAIRVVFSEPIEKASVSNFKLDGKTFYGAVDNKGTNAVILTPYDSSLTVGEHTLTVAGVEDYFGLKSLSSDTKFSVVEDKVAPTLKSVTATLEKAVVTFSEVVDPSTVSATNVYWLQGTSKVKPASVKQLAGDKYEFDFSNAPLPAWETLLYVEGVKDYSGNAISETSIKVKAEVDSVRPEVKEVKAATDGLSFTVKFSKKLKDNAEDAKYFTVTDKDGKVRSVSSVDFTDATHTALKVTLYAKLPEGSNTVKISGIKDATTLENTMLDYSTTISVGDNTLPSVSSSSTDGTTKRVIITFSEKMDIATIANPSNYLINFGGITRALPSNVEITVIQDAKGVLLQFPAKFGDTAVTFGGTGLTNVQVMGVKDLAGNVLSGYSYPVAVSAVDKASVQDYSTSYAGYEAVVTDKNTIKVKFDKGLAKAPKEAFTLSGGFAVTSTSIDNNVVTLKVSDLNTDSTPSITIDGDLLETLAGSVANDTTITPGNVLDQISPEVATGQTTYATVGNVISVGFTEPLDGDATAGSGVDTYYTNDLVVTRVSDNTVLRPNVDYTTNLSSDLKSIEITLTTTGAASGSDAKYTVAVKEDAKYITDRSAAKNAVVAKAAVVSTNAIDLKPIGTVTVAGTYKSGDATKIEANETLVFTFDDVVDATDLAALEAEFATVFAPGAGSTGFTVSSANVAGKTVVTVVADGTYVATAIATFNTNGTITLTAANLTDDAGNTPSANLVVNFK